MLFTIRLAKTDDAKAMMECHRLAVFSKAGSHYSSEDLEAWSPGATPDRVTRVESEIRDSDFIVLVAENDNELLGFAMVKSSSSELRAVYAKPSKQKGIGYALLQRIEEEAQRRGVKQLKLDSSLNAEAFYKAHGYAFIEYSTYEFRDGDTPHFAKIAKMQKALV